MPISIEHKNTPIECFLDNFAGRKDMDGYDPTKRIKIAEENRDFVWPEEMQTGFIVSVLEGYPIPQMVICDNDMMDGGNRSTVLMKWRANGFTVKVGDWQGNYDAMTKELSAIWNRAQIPFADISGATREERCTIYENYNKGVVLTCGHMLKNRAYRPLVHKANAMIGRGDGVFPFPDLIRQAWKKSWKHTKTLGELTFAYQILVGSMSGPSHFHSSFPRHVDLLTDTIEDGIDLSNLEFICEVIRDTDPTNTIASAKMKETLFKKFIGAMIYDVHNLPHDAFEIKWSAFYKRVYEYPKEDIKGLFKRLNDTGSSRAKNHTRLQHVSQNIANFIAGNVPDDITEYSSDTDDE